MSEELEKLQNVIEYSREMFCIIKYSIRNLIFAYVDKIQGGGRKESINWKWNYLQVKCLIQIKLK